MLAEDLAYKSLPNALDYGLIKMNKAEVESCYSIPDIGKSEVPKAWGSVLVNRKSKGLERGGYPFGDPEGYELWS